MFFSRSFIASALLGLATATTHAGEMATPSETLASASAAPAEAAPTGGMTGGMAGMGMVNTHVIDVGGPNGSLVFTPANVKAAPGDLIQFQFHPKNHSVVQSTFDQPCVPIQNVMTNKTDAFFSGFMPSNASLGAKSQLLTYTIRVMDEKPVWFYCSQGQHCQAGMVGAINAPETGNKTVEAFTNLARAATENLSPGQVAGQGNASPGGSASPSGEAAPGGGSGGSGAGGAGGAGASPTSPSPAQQSTSAASGRLFDACRQTLLTLGMGTMVAFLVL